MKALVTANFDKDVKSGLIQVIVAAHEFYPDMHNLPLLYGDKLSRLVLISYIISILLFCKEFELSKSNLN